MIMHISDIITGLKKSWILITGSLLPITFSTYKDYNNSVAIAFPAQVWNVVLTKNIEQHFTLPIGATVVLIKSNSYDKNSGNYYIRIGDSSIRAAIPTINIIDHVGSIINSPGFTFKPSDSTLSVIADSNTILSFAFFS